MSLAINLTGFEMPKETAEDVLRRIMLGDKNAQRLQRRAQVFDNADVYEPPAGRSFAANGLPIRWTLRRAARFAELVRREVPLDLIAQQMHISQETAQRKYERLKPKKVTS